MSNVNKFLQKKVHPANLDSLKASFCSFKTFCAASKEQRKQWSLRLETFENLLIPSMPKHSWEAEGGTGIDGGRDGERNVTPLLSLFKRPHLIRSVEEKNSKNARRELAFFIFRKLVTENTTKIKNVLKCLTIFAFH